VDIVDRATRSRMMAGIKGRDTKPERVVRSQLHRAGFRFRLHRRDLPGSPDIVLPRWNAVIFVHGCFWHRHPGCSKASTPRTRARFWNAKFAGNIERDRRNLLALRRLGWRVKVVWECSIGIRQLDALIRWIEKY
jgi:DNA mismatch endonuclease (patch repair protein)